MGFGSRAHHAVEAMDAADCFARSRGIGREVIMARPRVRKHSQAEIFVRDPGLGFVG